MDLDVIAGNISGAGSAAVGGAVAVPVITKNTHAFIGDHARVNGKGDGALGVKSGSISSRRSTRDSPERGRRRRQDDQPRLRPRPRRGQQVVYDKGSERELRPRRHRRYYVEVIDPKAVRLRTSPGGPIVAGLGGRSGETHRLVRPIRPACATTSRSGSTPASRRSPPTKDAEPAVRPSATPATPGRGERGAHLQLRRRRANRRSVDGETYYAPSSTPTRSSSGPPTAVP